jgi:hypothetical protein
LKINFPGKSAVVAVIMAAMLSGPSVEKSNHGSEIGEGHAAVVAAKSVDLAAKNTVSSPDIWPPH